MRGPRAAESDPGLRIQMFLVAQVESLTRIVSVDSFDQMFEKENEERNASEGSLEDAKRSIFKAIGNCCDYSRSVRCRTRTPPPKTLLVPAPSLAKASNTNKAKYHPLFLSMGPKTSQELNGMPDLVRCYLVCTGRVLSSRNVSGSSLGVFFSRVVRFANLQHDLPRRYRRDELSGRVDEVQRISQSHASAGNPKK